MNHLVSGGYDMVHPGILDSFGPVSGAPANPRNYRRNPTNRWWRNLFLAGPFAPVLGQPKKKCDEKKHNL